MANNCITTFVGDGWNISRGAMTLAYGKKCEMKLQDYVDADFAIEVDNRWSTIRYMFVLDTITVN